MARMSAVANLRKLFRVQEVGVLLALLLLCGYLFLSTPTFRSTDNLLNVVRSASTYAILAIGMVFVLVMGVVDLSVGSIMTLSNVVMALLLLHNAPIPVAILAALATGAVCGMLNGVFSVLFRIPMIIVTLGTLNLYRGTALIVSDGRIISEFERKNWFFAVAGGDLFGIPAGVIVMVVLCGVAWIAFVRTVQGRRIQAIGGNPLAARLSGLPITRYRIGVMTLSGLTSSLAGIMTLAFFRASNPNSGEGAELWAIASAIIGGTALSGGVGSVPGAILGALMIAVIRNGLIQRGYSGYHGMAVTGAIIILAVAIDSLVKRRAASLRST